MMQPEKYLRDLESSSRRKVFFGKLNLSLVFFSCFLFLGPFIHEIGHIAVLKIYSCFYRVDFGFSILSGLHATVSPFCALKPFQSLSFYSIGYLSTLIASGFTGILAIQRRTGFRYLGAASSGLLLSVLLSVGAEGDIQNAVEVLGLSQSYSLGIVLFILIGVFLTSLRTIQIFLELEREERDA